MDLREAKARNRFLIQIIKVIESYIFTERDREKAEAMHKLVAKNAYMLGGDTSPSFMHNGIMYHAWPYTPDRKSNKRVHPDMLAEIIEYMNFEDFEAKTAERSVMNYVGNAVLAAQHIDDLFNLIPERIHSPLSYVSADAFNIGEPMNETAIVLFNEKNKAGLHSFKRLFLERLLLA